MNKVIEEIIATAKRTPRLYFAPLIGAVRGIRDEYRRIAEEENAARKARYEVTRTNGHAGR